MSISHAPRSMYGRIQTQEREIPVPEVEVREFSPEHIMSMQSIREYTKTDDVPTITDEQLSLYRGAALESAEQYTSFLLHKNKRIIEDIEKPATSRARLQGYVKHELEYPVSDGRIYFYGSYRGRDDKLINVKPGSKIVRIPIVFEALDVNECCGSCRGGVNFGAKIMYSAGFESVDQIPSGVILGCHRFIAWCVSNPGDIIQTLKNRKISGEVGIVGSNNIALSSGALELWRQYTRDV